MQLKRLYNHAAPRDDWKPQSRPCAECRGRGVVINAAGDGVAPCAADGCEGGTITQLVPPVRGIEVRHAGPTQRFSASLLDGAAAEGWLRRDGDTLILTPATGAPLTYRIVRSPGAYCCHCQQPVEGGPDAQAHVQRRHPGVPSPDPTNPAGYRRDNFYECVREG